MTSSFDIEAARNNLRKTTEKRRAIIRELDRKATADFECYSADDYSKVG